MKKNYYFLIILGLLSFTTCKKEKSNPCDATVSANLPAVAIDSVYRDNTDKIIVTGNVLGAGQDDAGLTAHGVVWSQNLTPSLQNGQSKDLGAASGTGRFTVTLDSLPPGDYQFRTYATNCTGTQYSSSVKNLMVTVQGKPFVQVKDHYLITATGNDGIINPGDDVQYGFTVQNVGTLKADAVTATIYTAATQYIGNLAPASINIGALNAGGAISGAQTLSFKVAANTPPGQYCLNVDIDADGETNADTICFEVLQTVKANFSIQNNNCKAPCTVIFTNTSEGANSYLWDFGDGSTSAEQHPQHIYQKFGSFNVALTVIGLNDLKDTFNQNLVIGPRTFATQVVNPGWSQIYFNTVFEQSNDTYLLALNISGISNFKFTGLLPMSLDGDIDFSNLVHGYGDRIVKIDDQNFLYCSTKVPFTPGPPVLATFGKFNMNNPDNGISIVKSNFEARDITYIDTKVYFAGIDLCGGYSRLYTINNLFQTTDSIQIRKDAYYCDSNCWNCTGNIPSDFVVIDQRLFFVSPYGIYRKETNESVILIEPLSPSSLANHLISTADNHLVCYNNDNGVVLKLDQNGLLKWQIDLGTEILDIAGKKDGHLVAVSYTTLYEINGVTGQINWSKPIPWIESTDLPYHVTPTQDGGLLISGSSPGGGAVNLLKTDDKGNL